VMKGVAPPHITMKDIYLAAMPFIGCVILLILIIIFFPPIVTWLPKVSH
jgi:TRAP-type mannitol/chloroaromatic compound transport system permease large subunit